LTSDAKSDCVLQETASQTISRAQFRLFGQNSTSSTCDGLVGQTYWTKSRTGSCVTSSGRCYWYCSSK